MSKNANLISLNLKCQCLMFFVYLFSACTTYRYNNEAVDEKLWENFFAKERTGQSHAGLKEVSNNLDKFIDGIKKKSELTLQDCFALALANNERLKVVGEDYFQTIIEKDKAISLILPAIFLRGQYLRQETVPSFGGSSFLPKARTDYWLNIKQPLFKGLSDIYTLKAAKKNIKSKESMLYYERAQIFSLVVFTFYEILQQQKRKEILTALLKTRKERLEEMKERRKLGLLRDTELLLVETQIANDEALLEEVVNSIEILKARMEAIIGISVDKPLKDSFVGEKTVELAELLERAYNNRMDLKSKEMEINALKDKLKATKGEYLPSISLNSNIYFKRAGFQKDIDWDAAIIFDIPLFEGWITKAKVEEDLSKLRKAQYSYIGLKKQVTNEVKASFYELKTIRSLISKLEKEVELAQKNYDMLKEEYAQKIATGLELLFAEVNLQSAKIRLETEKLNERRAVLNLKIVTGEEIWQNR